MRHFRFPSVAFLATVPFLLLSGAEQVYYQTYVYPDGSGYRIMTVDVNPDQVGDIRQRAVEAQPLSSLQTERKTPGNIRIERNYWAPGIERLPDTALLTEGLLANPLSLFDKYEWTETIKIYTETATAAQKAGATLSVLNYTLDMPGAVAEESVSPPGQVEANSVTWKLTADKPEYTLKATSYHLRYGFLAFVLYVLICGAVLGGRFLARVIGNRPRKI